MRALLIAAWLLLAGAAWAQPVEQVVVEKQRGLDGLWQIETPKSTAIRGFFRAAEFGPMRPLYCRIENEDTIYCLNGGYSAKGSVTRDGDQVHIAWGMMMARFVIDAALKDDTLTGTFTFKISGISHDAPTPSHSNRIAAGGPASAQGTALLAQFKQSRAALPRTTDALGAIEHVTWLGASAGLDNSGGNDFFSVYSVEFSGGQRICASHPEADGSLKIFQCL